ncbi:MAG TPA: hypothetical protein VNK82_00135 [Terriglobales bacterium]|nr:hypothetical protein [Terriglobales bacterium]
MTSPAIRFAPRWLRGLLLALAVFLGLFRAIADRDLQGGDTVSYLDIAFSWARGDFGAAVNAFWSPLYSWLLAAMLIVLRPAPDWEFTAVSFVGFAVYLGLLASFLFMWRAVETWRRSSSAGDSASVGPSPVPCSLLAYALFLWCIVDLTKLTRSPADMMMAASLFLACGLLARMQTGDLRPVTFALLGSVLGLGYLAKAPILPLTPVILIAALLIARRPRLLLPAVGCLLLFVLPWAAVLSLQKRRFTWGDTAHLNYAFHVNRAPMFHWEGKPEGTGTPVHPPRKLSSSPAFYEFAEPVPGSYPIWYDPSYWNEGLWPHFELRQQWEALTRTVPLYQFVLRSRPDLILVPLILLLHFALLSPGARIGLDRSAWFLFLPAVAGFAMYSLVYVERRHIAVFVVLFWTAVFASLRFPESGRTGRLAGRLAVLLLASTLGLILLGVPEDCRAIRERPDRVHWQVAQELMRRGARPGDRIAVIGGGLWSAPLAHLARVRIAAEIPPYESTAFWSAERPTQAALMHRAAQVGIRLVVADCTNCSPPPGCTRFPNTSVLARFDQRDFYVCDPAAFTADSPARPDLGRQPPVTGDYPGNP